MSDLVSAQEARSYAANLPIASAALERFPEEHAVDIENLPAAVVVGSNLVGFEDTLPPRIRSSVADSLLLAQLATDYSAIVRTPQQWHATYRTVLGNLGWRETKFSTVQETFDNVNVAVHEAIIPYLTAALGPAAAVGTMITTALTQLSQMDKDEPWITLFERESKRLNVSDYQFSTVTKAGLDTEARLVGATLSDKYGKTRVLFFNITSSKAKFDLAAGTFAASSNLLEIMDEDLKIKLRDHIRTFIREVPIP